MGTSKGLKTPSGKGWREPKRQLNDYLDSGQSFDADAFVRAALVALGGLAIIPKIIPGGSSLSSIGQTTSDKTSATPNVLRVGTNRARVRPGGAGGASSGGVTGAAGGTVLGRTVRGLGGFGAGVASGGLDQALHFLGLEQLRGRPASEVIAQVAERLSSGATGRQAEILEAALRETIFDIAAIENAGSYADLEGALQSFINRDGLEGFVEAFLSQYIFTAVWSYFENHADTKSEANEGDALVSAIESACRSLVSQELKMLKDSKEFEQVDWFGDGGQQFANKIVERLQSGLDETKANL